MSTAAGPVFLAQKLGDIGKDLSVQAAILDRFGVIVAVNEQWKRFAETCGLTLPQYGIGENYLRHCAFADPLSPRLIRGLSQVISGEINRLSVVYSCSSENGNAKTWFLLLAFPHPEDTDYVAVMHIDITVLVAVFSIYRRDTPVDDLSGGRSSVAATADDGQPASTAERTILSLVGEAGERGRAVRRPSQRSEFKDARMPPLSKRQLEVLSLMAKGMTNAEIAHGLGLSLNTVKVYVSGILARLGLQSRAQVLHWALTRLKDDADM